MSICSRVFFSREIIGRFFFFFFWVSKRPFILYPKYEYLVVLSGSSVSKESACSAGDLGSIPGSGRPPGEGNAKPLQYPCLENPMDRGAWRATVHGVAKVGHNLATKPPPKLLKEERKGKSREGGKTEETGR